MLFSSGSVENIARDLCGVMDKSNMYNILSGMGSDQIYGPAYYSFQNLLIMEFGKEVTDSAMSSREWNISDFDDGVIKVIEQVIEEVEELKLQKKLNDMYSFLGKHIGFERVEQFDKKIGISLDGDKRLYTSDWNEVMDLVLNKDD